MERLSHVCHGQIGHGLKSAVKSDFSQMRPIQARLDLIMIAERFGRIHRIDRIFDYEHNHYFTVMSRDILWRMASE